MTVEQQKLEMDELLKKFCKEHKIDYDKVDRDLLLKNIIVQTKNNEQAKKAYINIMKDVVRKKALAKRKEILDTEILLLEFEGEILVEQLAVLKQVQQERKNEVIRV